MLFLKCIYSNKGFNNYLVFHYVPDALSEAMPSVSQPASASAAAAAAAAPIISVDSVPADTLQSLSAQYTASTSSVVAAAPSSSAAGTNILPYFDFDVQRNITVTVGQTGFLHCRVERLGDKDVSFVTCFSSSRGFKNADILCLCVCVQGSLCGVTKNSSTAFMCVLSKSKLHPERRKYTYTFIFGLHVRKIRNTNSYTAARVNCYSLKHSQFRAADSEHFICIYPQPETTQRAHTYHSTYAFAYKGTVSGTL